LSSYPQLSNYDLGNPLLLFLPRRNDATDAIRYMAQALETIAGLEDMSLEEALTKIQRNKENNYQPKENRLPKLSATANKV
jgi:hypothetical protein